VLAAQAALRASVQSPRPEREQLRRSCRELARLGVGEPHLGAALDAFCLV
jgi:hypothetical protein